MRAIPYFFLPPANHGSTRRRMLTIRLDRQALRDTRRGDVAWSDDPSGLQAEFPNLAREGAQRQHRWVYTRVRGDARCTPPPSLSFFGDTPLYPNTNDQTGFIQGMLMYDPAKRMSAKTALKCDYFLLPGGKSSL